MSVLAMLLTRGMSSAGVGTSSRTDSGGNYIAYGVQPGSYAVAVQSVIDVVDGELKKDAVETARSLIEAAVQRKYQELQTSGLQADLKRGRNRFDVNLSTQRLAFTSQLAAPRLDTANKRPYTISRFPAFFCGVATAATARAANQRRR